MSDIADLEDLLMDAIAAALPYLKNCLPYAGELEKDQAQLGMRTPAVLLAMSKMSSEPGEDFQSWRHTYSFDLLVLARNLRGEDQARRTTAGAYQILADLRTCLVDQVLRSDLQPVVHIQEEAQYLGTEYVTYTATYEVAREEVEYG